MGRAMRAGQLAKKIGVAPSVVSAWENDKRGLPETPTLFKLAKALNCSIGDLLRGVDEEYDRAEIARGEYLNDKLAELRQLLREIGPGDDEHVIVEELSSDQVTRLLNLTAEISTLMGMTTHLWPKQPTRDEAEATLLQDWQSLTDEERSAIQLLIEGRLAARERRRA